MWQGFVIDLSCLLEKASHAHLVIRQHLRVISDASHRCRRQRAHVSQQLRNVFTSDFQVHVVLVSSKRSVAQSMALNSLQETNDAAAD